MEENKNSRKEEVKVKPSRSGFVWAIRRIIAAIMHLFLSVITYTGLAIVMVATVVYVLLLFIAAFVFIAAGLLGAGIGFLFFTMLRSLLRIVYLIKGEKMENSITAFLKEYQKRNETDQKKRPPLNLH